MDGKTSGLRRARFKDLRYVSTLRHGIVEAAHRYLDVSDIAQGVER